MKQLNKSALSKVAGGGLAGAAGTIGVGAAMGAGFMVGGPVGAVVGGAIAGGILLVGHFAIMMK